MNKLFNKNLIIILTLQVLLSLASHYFLFTSLLEPTGKGYDLNFLGNQASAIQCTLQECHIKSENKNTKAIIWIDSLEGGYFKLIFNLVRCIFIVEC